MLGIVLALALAAGAEAAAPVKKVELTSLDASNVLRHGALSVRVKARRAGRVRVGAGKLAKARTVRFRHRGARTVRLRSPTPARRPTAA
jgi:hypothetical protein